MADSASVVHCVVGSANSIPFLSLSECASSAVCSVRCAACFKLLLSLDSVRNVLRPVESAHTGEH